jgi:hypothetical protein
MEAVSAAYSKLAKEFVRQPALSRELQPYTWHSVMLLDTTLLINWMWQRMRWRVKSVMPNSVLQ